METLETLKRAVERGYFTFEDACAFGKQARLIEDRRLETEVDDEDPSGLKSRAQDIGLWVDYVSPHGKKVRFRFTIPATEEIQLNYRGLGYNPDDFHLFTAFSPRVPSDEPAKTHRRRGIRLKHC